MCTYPFVKKALTLYLARGEGRERYFGCNLMQRKILATSHQHLMAEAPLMHKVDLQRVLFPINCVFARQMEVELQERELPALQSDGTPRRLC